MNDDLIDNLFDGFEDNSEELYKKRTERYARPKLESGEDQKESSDLDQLFVELENDSQIKFSQKTLILSKDCARLASKFAAYDYENVLRLKVRRSLKGKKIFDTIQLKNEYGQIYDMTFASLSFEKYDPTRKFRGEALFLPTKNGTFLVPRKSVKRVIDQMLTLVKDKAKDTSFRINETNYFSLLQTQNHRPFLMGTYYCSKRADFVFD